MNKRLISRLMRERVSGLRELDGYFSRGNFEYVFRGILFEYRPNGLYIWDFRLPLFEFSGPRILTYSNRLYGRSGYIKKGEMSEKDIAEFIVSFPEVMDVFGSDKPETVSDFIRFVDSKPSILLGSINARLTYISALLLDDQDSRATSMLGELQHNFDMNKYDVVNYKLLYAKLQQGTAEARALLERVRRKNLQTLGVVAESSDDNVTIEWAQW
jgi:hypothetical protein